ncbi:glycosyltransferase family 4 protein [Rhizobium ruizarguesonis]|jgi:glycosyltransferase involved in cell wall biosynthesis|uniref:glycosyltransferase family 4 protein n=1 Tax=Rhizobium ruizarguesonis TaxID=2081791 RepID=UPI00102F3F08|nr:glycosyltransferase family 4 protein [Rhizobium ruizarguesonis]TAU25153.1 glycosyltransferase [Rhizobium ruizarguesonis]TAU66796.1 glycosyltransferase [Rhizobium ruizarguesonis]TAW08547.1 glycosyltransferase [Rhizobium ruizarguesonis]TAY77931.1 glycosyltransferase [Rhizobium ruizarguesonis]TAZ33438.1 glycosyltransferase [Rhizobium ruizarguesonis]
MTKRILFVGMVDSPHTARWINQVSDLGWDLHIFPVYHAPAHRLLKGVTVHRPWLQIRPRFLLKQFLTNPRNAFNLRKSLREAHPNRLEVRSVLPLPAVGPLEQALAGIQSEPLGESDVRAPLFYGPHVLARLIRKLKPDLIHSMEFQHAGYLTLRAKELSRSKPFPKWLATNWGSDIYYYRNFADHKKQITRLLSEIDYYSCECERDVELAKEMGLTAPVLPVMPNTGGFDIEQIEILREGTNPSERRIIMVKGYEHFAGRALTALDAVAMCADVLRGYRVVVFSASAAVRERVEELRMFHGLDISILEHAGHDKMLKYFAHARAYLGVSVSDAISTSMLEAMALGSFPIQTDSSCCSEWIQHGRTGFAVRADDVRDIAAKLRMAVTDDDLVNDAEEMNWQTVLERLDQRKLKPQAERFYEFMLP